MKSLKLVLLALVVVWTSQNMAAQEMQAKKHDNLNWHVVAFVKFNPGQKDAAIKLIDDYFVKADEKAGTPHPVFAMDMATGEYDYVIGWKMAGGIQAMDWEMSPDDVKWFGAMTEIAGGPDKVQEKMKEFYSYVALWRVEIGRNMIE
ncbi:hypothetical protein [Christiangramia aquimixticola]|uniref:hypothetical protein n=1 Tax=Christiangramia aquimixticola TaxID=1697558 RepID=UPI003AA7C3B7